MVVRCNFIFHYSPLGMDHYAILHIRVGLAQVHINYHSYELIVVLNFCDYFLWIASTHKIFLLNIFQTMYMVQTYVQTGLHYRHIIQKVPFLLKLINVLVVNNEIYRIQVCMKPILKCFQ